MRLNNLKLKLDKMTKFSPISYKVLVILDKLQKKEEIRSEDGTLTTELPAHVLSIVGEISIHHRTESCNPIVETNGQSV